MKKTSLKKMIIWGVVGLAAVILLVGIILLLGNQVQDVRRSLLGKQLSLEGSLKAAVFQASLQDQLIQHRPDIIRIEGMMPTQDEIGAIIGSFEVEGKKFGVTVAVPEVHEEVAYDKKGDPVEQVGPVRTVRMNIQAQGNPVALIGFMHAIENSPFLLGTISFMFDSDSASVSGGSVTSIPQSKPPGAESAPKQIEPRRASLKMEVRLTILAEEIPK
jgi:hypothetical protein